MNAEKKELDPIIPGKIVIDYHIIPVFIASISAILLNIIRMKRSCWKTIL